MIFFKNAGTTKKGLAGATLAIAIATVSAWEGFSSKPYVDRIGTGQPETWCYGETAADGPPPPYTKVFTKQECQTELGKRLQDYDKDLQKCLAPSVYAALPPHRHAALVSFDYNVGGGAFCKSSVARYLNAGSVTRGCNALLLYDRAGGRVVQGLANRRKAERGLCLMND